jgi:hypothetical protein
MHSNSREHDNSTVEGGDLHMVSPEPASGNELTNRLVEYRIQQKTKLHRRQKTNINQKKTSEMKSLFYVV